METRANHVWVGAVTLALIVALAGFFVWLARLEQSHRQYYDIYFHQSVDGLGKGTDVSYAGVPAGQVREIELSKNDPGVVRVRVAIDSRIPILQGTTAAIQGSFTGVSNIQLSGGQKGAALISDLGPDGAPVIPTTRSGLGALLSSAPVLMEKISTLTDRLSDTLSDANQKQITGILANSNRMTKTLADTAPQMKNTLADLHATLAQATQTLATLQQAGASANAMLGPDGNSVTSQLRATLKSAQAATDALQAEVNDARVPTQQLAKSTLPQAEAALRDLRASSKALRDITEKLDDNGAGAVISGQKLPEYHP